MKLTIFTFEFKCLSTKKVIEILTPPTCDLAKICMLFLCVVHVDDCIVPTSSNSNCSQYCHTTQRRIHQWCSPVHRVLRVQVRVLRVWVRVRVLCIRVGVWVLTKGLESESLKNMDSSPTRVHCRTRVLHHWNACMYQWHVLVIRLFITGKNSIFLLQQTDTTTVTFITMMTMMMTMMSYFHTVFLKTETVYFQ